MKKEKLTLQSLSDEKLQSLENEKLKKVFGGMSLLSTTTTLKDVTVSATVTTVANALAASFASLDCTECTGDTII